MEALTAYRHPRTVKEEHYTERKESTPLLTEPWTEPWAFSPAPRDTYRRAHLSVHTLDMDYMGHICQGQRQADFVLVTTAERRELACQSLFLSRGSPVLAGLWYTRPREEDGRKVVPFRDTYQAALNFCYGNTVVLSLEESMRAGTAQP